MMDFNDTEHSSHGEMLFGGSDHGSVVNITPNFSLTVNTISTVDSANPAAQEAPAVVFNTVVENYAEMNSEYLKRRYKRRHENPEKIRELMAESTTIVENLRTAIEAKMDVAAVGVLQGILLSIEAGSGNEITVNYSTNPKDKDQYVEDAGDRQRALFKANICNTVIAVMRELGGHVVVCEKALSCVAYLCRYSEEYKASVCLENTKAFGVCGISDLIVSAIKKHNNNKNILSAACDAIRSLCALASNRDRLGQAGACETITRALIKYMNNPELIGWLCRAIGHLCNNNSHNLELVGSNGGCENIILALQKYPTNVQVCIECCYAMRNAALCENNRGRLIRDFAPESILAVYKHHFANEVFAIEACHAVVNMITNESDELINRIANSGFIGYSIKSVKKNPDSEHLARWVYQGLYYMACDDKVYNKLLTSEILDTLSVCLENHGGEENMAEWGCRFIEKVLAQATPHTLEITTTADADKKEKGGVKIINKGSQALYIATCAKLRTAGMCEMITSAVQRQAISATVASIGSLCIGQLARDHNNLSRLSSSGACEAVVTALKRHAAHTDVCTNTCYSIYYLCKSVNNISWMGAYGACEAVCNALKSYATDANVVRYASLAIAALAYKDEGNLSRLHLVDVNNILVSACSAHIATDCFIAENMCHAISNLCLENTNVSDLGKYGACGLVVSILYQYANMHTVSTQALTAIAALAVKQKFDKIHKGNTRKLVEKGALEVTIAVMQKFIEYDDVQRAGGLALTALARLEVNKLKLAELNVCDLIMQSMKLHITNPLVLVKLIYAIDALTWQCETNILKFTALHVVDLLFQVLAKHENVFYIVESIYRALTNICLMNKIVYATVFNENGCKLIVKTLKLHEKHERVAKWGCHLIYTATAPPNMHNNTIPGLHQQHGGGSGKDGHHSHDSHKSKGSDKDAAVTTVTVANSIPLPTITEVRRLFGQATKAPETLVSILNKYTLESDNHGHKEKDKEDKKSSDNSQMNNMHTLHHYHITTHVEVLIYTSMAIYTLTLFDQNKGKFLHNDVSLALLKILSLHYKEPILCEWLLISINTLLLTNYNEKSRLGQQLIMPSLFNVLNTYCHNQHENHMQIVKLACECAYELCLIYYNQQELIVIKDSGTTVVDLMMGLMTLYKDNLELITIIIKAISSICINNTKSTNNKSASTTSLFGSTSNMPPPASNEHVVANAFVDAGLADSLLKAMDHHHDSAPLVQWVCACVVSLCMKNSKVQVLFVSHYQLIVKLTPILVQHKNVLPCVTQIARCFRSLVLNITNHNAPITKSSIILPTMLELLQLHLYNDALVEHACYLLGNIEYKPSSAMWGKLQGSIKRGLASSSKDSVSGKQEEMERAVTPLRSYSQDLFSSPTNKVTGIDSYASPAPGMSTPSAATPGTAAALSAKAFYANMANYDLLFSVLQTHLNKNTSFNQAIIAPSGNLSASPATTKGYNNNNVIRSICMAITIFAEKGKLHHHNICTLLYTLLNKESMLNNNDEQLIQKMLVCVGTLCKNNEQNNSLLCETNALIEEMDVYIHEYKESNVVLYGVFYTIIGICEFNLQANQNKINSCENIVPLLIQILYNDLETDFISQFGCLILASITKNHLKNKLKCHSVSNYIADVLITHKHNPTILIEGLKAISSLADRCISNRNRLGTSDACHAVCAVFHHGSAINNVVLEDEYQNTTTFMKFPNNIYHWGVRSIGELAANHANNCSKLGAAGACEILVTMLKRPQLSPAEYITEMKLHSVIYWALANLLQPTKGSNVAGAADANQGGHRSSLASIHSTRSNSTAPQPVNLMSSLNINATNQIKNTTRLYNLNLADTLITTISKSLAYETASLNSSPTVVPYVTYIWACRLLACLGKSQRIKMQLMDNNVLELVDGMAAVADANLSGPARKDYKEVLEWAAMAKEILSSTDINIA